MNMLEQKSNSQNQHICCQIFELVPFCIVIDVGKYWCRVHKKTFSMQPLQVPSPK